MYIDPGSGLLWIQGLGIVSAAVLYWMRKKIAAIFARRK